MTEVVLDASVVVKWFTHEERGADDAVRLRGEYHAGRLFVAVPSLLYLEILNVAARRWNWGADALLELAGTLEELAFANAEPDISSVAAWAGRGLTAYDAAYVALAEGRGIRLVTDDQDVLAIAGDIATPLVGSPSPNP